MKRVFTIDFTRGMVMIIMALDHVRDLLHVHSATQSPTDLATTNPLLFFTRWITYLCAPIFVFLAGTSAYISFRNKRSAREMRRFLITRGLWLILLEFTVVNFGIFFDPGFHTLMFEVIAAIGFGLIILGLLLGLDSRIVGVLGLLIIFLHNLIPSIPFVESSGLKSVISLLFNFAAAPVSAHTTFVMAYPPVPWLGIMLVGFATGIFFQKNPNGRDALFLRIGIACLLLFIVLRFTNIYGDPIPWTAQKNAVFTFLSFMNVTKYPPSLLFCLVTLGIMFLIFVWGEKNKGKGFRMVSVYGKASFFYFIIHFYLIHLILIVVLLLQGFGWADMDFATGAFGRPRGAVNGVSLAAVYIIWICVVLLLYKPCLWYGRYKMQHKDKQWWLRYI